MTEIPDAVYNLGAFCFFPKKDNDKNVLMVKEEIKKAPLIKEMA